MSTWLASTQRMPWHGHVQLAEQAIAMDSGAPIRLVGMTLGLALICIPLALLVTLLAIPFWSWLENRFTIESIGHSGPAEWCYLVVYLLLLILGGVIWSYRGQGNQA